MLKLIAHNWLEASEYSMAVCDTHVVISQSSEHDKDLAVPTLEVAILEGRARKQDGTERYLVGRQPVERLSEHCGTQTDRQP